MKNSESIKRDFKKSLMLIVPFMLMLLILAMSLISQKQEDVKKAGVSDSDADQEVDSLTFSQESGFYDSEFDLTIQAPEGYKIYYTLDSSVPTVESILYTDPIHVRDISEDENVWSMLDTFMPYKSTPIYSGQKASYPNAYCQYSKPDNPVDKCTVIRAIAVDPDGQISDVKTASYFVGYQDKKGYENVSVMSIVSDPDGLFGEENGIMVMGKAYMDLARSGQAGNKTFYEVRDMTNAYSGRGSEWEREAHMDYFDSDDSSNNFSQEIGVRLHGNHTRVSKVQKSFNLYARKRYDGNKTFLAPFFEDGVLSDTVTITRAENVRNYYFSDKMNHRTMDSQNYRLVQVFIDGEYWGFYAIQERYNSESYMKAHYNLDEDEYILATGKPYSFKVQNGEPNTDGAPFLSLRNYAAKHDLSVASNYENVKSMMDIQSFIDVYAARIYLADVDWNWFKNMYVLYYDDKWHWLIYDLDNSASYFKICNPDVDTFTGTRIQQKENLGNDRLFPYLMKNEEFQKDFCNTFMDIANYVYNAETVAAELDAFNEEYWNSSMKSLTRYPQIGESLIEDYNTHTSAYTRECEVIKDFFNQRFPYAAQYLKSYFNLQGKLCNVTVGVEDVEAGYITINTITPGLGTTGSWTGKYYSDFPVTVTAKVKAGYKFVKWTSENGSIADETQETTTVSFTGNTKITAVYEKITP